MQRYISEPRKTTNYYFSGSPEEANETEEMIIQSICNQITSKIQIKPRLDVAYRIGAKTNLPRLIKAQFPFLQDRNKIWQNRKKLGHPYYVNEDFSIQSNFSIYNQ